MKSFHLKLTVYAVIITSIVAFTIIPLKESRCQLLYLYFFIIILIVIRK